MVGKIAFDIAAGIFGEKVTVEYEGNAFETVAVFEQVKREDTGNVVAHTVTVWIPEDTHIGYGAFLTRTTSETWQVMDVVRSSGVLKLTVKNRVRPHP